jgi:hypothetical protein
MIQKWARSFLFVICIVFLIVSGLSCKQSPSDTGQISESWELDSRSYQLGVIAAFSEIVAVGVKKLALSSPLPPEEMARLLPDAERIAKENGALLYLEKDFCVTDLFPGNITEGKHVLLIYLDPVKDTYLALKHEKATLIKEGRYQGEERRNIARKMGRLLSYPEERIEKMLKQTKTRVLNILYFSGTYSILKSDISRSALYLISETVMMANSSPS